MSENDTKIRELIRVIDATVGDINPDGLSTGQNAMLITKLMCAIPNFAKFVSPEFLTCIGQNLREPSGEPAKLEEYLTDESTNVNISEEIKTIFMWPKKECEPPARVLVPEMKLYRIMKNIMDRYEFTLKIVDGKVCAVPAEPGAAHCHDFIAYIFEQFGEYVNGFVPNAETRDIKIVDSDIVTEIGIERVQQFLNDCTLPFKIYTGEIMLAISEDCSRFSKCMMVKVDSDYLNCVLKFFNSQFGKKIMPPQHVTFAICLRSLWRQS